jgi:uncharacterized metal-binding protein
MPDGKTHAIATTVAAGALAPTLVLVFGQPWQPAVAFAAGCLVGLIVTPDLDVRHATRAATIVRRTARGWVGRLLGQAWIWFWRPYALLIPHHRHPLSHLPILGTALRLLYLLAAPTLVWLLVSLVLPLPPLARPYIGPLTWWGVAGLATVDALHTLMDRFWPGQERRVLHFKRHG